MYLRTAAKRFFFCRIFPFNCETVMKLKVFAVEHFQTVWWNIANKKKKAAWKHIYIQEIPWYVHCNSKKRTTLSFDEKEKHTEKICSFRFGFFYVFVSFLYSRKIYEHQLIAFSFCLAFFPVILTHIFHWAEFSFVAFLMKSSSFCFCSCQVKY